MDQSTLQLKQQVEAGTLRLDTIPARDLFFLQVHYYKTKNTARVKEIGAVAKQRKDNPLPWEDTRNIPLPPITTKKGTQLVFDKRRGVYVEQ